MKLSSKKLLCSVMIAATAILPVQMATAGMIPASEATVSATASADRAAVTVFLQRADVAKQLQSLGVEPTSAASRVAAMSDAEVRQLADQIQSAPAGADGGLALLILVVFFIWFFAFRR